MNGFLRRVYWHLKNSWKLTLVLWGSIFVVATIILMSANGITIDGLNKSIPMAFLYALLPNVLCSLFFYGISTPSSFLGSEVVAVKKTNLMLIEDILNHSTKDGPIKIIDTRITTLMRTRNPRNDNMEWFNSSLIESIENKRVSFHILLANPMAEFAFQRAKDKEMPKATYMEEHLHDLYALNKIRRGLGDKSDKLDVRIFDTMPPPVMHFFGGHAYVTFFPTEGFSDESEALKMTENTSLYREITTVFNSVLNDNRTVSLDDFIYCVHTTMSGVINFHYCSNAEYDSNGGSNSYGRVPEYVLVGTNKKKDFIEGMKLNHNEIIEFKLANDVYRVKIKDVPRSSGKHNDVMLRIRKRYQYSEKDLNDQVGFDPLLFHIEEILNGPVL